MTHDNNTLYEKRGRRYIPVAARYVTSSLPNGDWLVVVRDGLVKCRKAVDGTRGMQLLAATTELEETIVRLLDEASCAVPGRGTAVKLTERERRAYAAFTAIAGPQHPCWWTTPARTDIARKVAQELARRAAGITCNAVE
jgi:hypothetical protein